MGNVGISGPNRFKKLSAPFTLMMVFAILAVFVPALAIACAAIFLAGVILLAAEYVVSHLDTEDSEPNQSPENEE